MVTPYNNAGEVDYAAVGTMVEWYWKNGCDGIFASCQSSEIFYLSEDDRVCLAKCVKEKANVPSRRATCRSTFSPSAMTSGPMPSPAITAIL